MMNNKNIPDADQFWPGAEKLLDNHFRKRRLIRWLLALIIPSIMAGLSLLYFTRTSKEADKIISDSQDKNLYEQHTKSNTGSSGSLTADNSAAIHAVNKNRINESINKNNSLTVTNPQSKKSPAINNANEENIIANRSANTNTSTLKAETSTSGNKNKPGSLLVPAGVISVSATNINGSFSGAGVISNQTASPIPDISSNRLNQQPPSNTGVNHNNETVFALVPLNGKLNAGNPEQDVSGNTLPKVSGKSSHCPVGWMVNIYGSAQYVTKSLSTTNDWDSYIEQRKNEEEPIITPSFGLSLTASSHSLSISAGVEYSAYGEKTNYEPYSMQQKIIDNGSWQTYLRNYIDTDTAYVTGNQYFLQTSRSEMDSSYNANLDTLEEKAYDQKIAESNGINKLHYIEVPVEISYAISKGRAGVGISAGVAPGWLVGESGYYLRTDGKGVESFDEIKSFNKFMLNARVGLDFYYRLSARTKLSLRPQYKTNLNSIFEDSYGIKQKYSSVGVSVGISYMLN